MLAGCVCAVRLPFLCPPPLQYHHSYCGSLIDSSVLYVLCDAELLVTRMAPSTRTILFALIGLTALGAAAYYVKTEIFDKEKEGDYDSEDVEDDDEEEDIDDEPSAADTAKSREVMFSSISSANKNQLGDTTEGDEVDTLEPPAATPDSRNEKKKKKKATGEKKKEDDNEHAEKERIYEDTCNAAKKALQSSNYVLAAEKYSQGKLYIVEQETVAYLDHTS